MTSKKMRAQVGRAIRRATGIEFSVAMKIARVLVSGSGGKDSPWKKRGLSLGYITRETMENEEKLVAAIERGGGKLEVWWEGSHERGGLAARLVGPKGSLSRVHPDPIKNEP